MVTIRVYDKIRVPGIKLGSWRITMFLEIQSDFLSNSVRVRGIELGALESSKGCRKKFRDGLRVLGIEPGL